MAKSLLRSMSRGSGVHRPSGRWAAAWAGLALVFGIGFAPGLGSAASATATATATARATASAAATPTATTAVPTNETAWATSSDSVWVAPAANPSVIEFEGRETEPTSDDQLNESEETYTPRRLRPRELERPARLAPPPPLVDLVNAPSTRAVARLVARPNPGRDILTRHRRLLI